MSTHSEPTPVTAANGWVWFLPIVGLALPVVGRLAFDSLSDDAQLRLVPLIVLVAVMCVALMTGARTRRAWALLLGPLVISAIVVRLTVGLP